MRPFFYALLVILTSCASKQKSSHLISLQLIDRNGQTETISQPERVKLYEKQNFDRPQSYEKILRVYSKTEAGKNPSLITTYHKNGELFQKLEAQDARAFGHYEEHYENGLIRIKANVIEGTADLTELAQSTWVFDGSCHVFYPTGELEAFFTYDRGKKSGQAIYYHLNGKQKKLLNFVDDQADGMIYEYTDQGDLVFEYEFKNGRQDGTSIKYFTDHTVAFKEIWHQDELMEGSYFDPNGALISSIKNGKGVKSLFEDGYLSTTIEYVKGQIGGKIAEFDRDGYPTNYSHISNGQKEGEEGIYFPDSNQIKVLIDWHQDHISGIVKTFYKTGVLESQKTYSTNKKNGPSSCYYPDGSLMMLETYSQDRLIEGKYFKKGESEPSTFVEDGTGCASIFDEWGGITQQIHYEKGKVVLPEDY